MTVFHAYVLRRREIQIVLIAILCICTLSIYIYTSNTGVMTATQAKKAYVAFAVNDLGMHCIQPDYSSFLILPPANTLKVQVFRKGRGEAKLISSGITVSYEVVDNTTSANKTDFWKYAKDYGYDVPIDVGITGNRLKGECVLSSDKKYYEATAIPVIPYNDGAAKKNPYQIAKVTVRDGKTRNVLAVLDKVVLPVSDEMDCSNCHGTVNTNSNILAAHDRLSKTSLAKDLKNGIRHKCAECHQDNILGEKGKPGIPSLSQAMHGFHSSKVVSSPVDPVCWNCHPGVETKCYRGRMYLAKIKCADERCHGDMAKIARTLANGRQAWLQEPDCGTCHGAKYSVNANLLYRNSYLRNSPAGEMNNLIQCESCHNGTHAEWKSALELDNELPRALQGYAGSIGECSVCHSGEGKMHRGR